MTDMSNWTVGEKLEYVPLLRRILLDLPIDDDVIKNLSPNVKTAIRDILRPDR